MTTQTEALKMALEALDGAETLLSQMGLTHLLVYGNVDKAITTIKEALAVDKESLTTEARHMPSNDALYKAWNLIGADLAGLKFEDFAKNLLAQQSNEQVEPAFWYRNEDIFGNQEMEPIFYATKAWVNCLPLYTHPPVPTAQPEQEPDLGGVGVFYPQEQEPVAWKPIETAPKDVMVLVCLPRQMNLVVRAWYNSIHNFWQTDYEGEGGITRPMYFHERDLWHPIPPLYTTQPQSTEQEQQIETLKRCLFQMQEAAKDLVEQEKSLPPPQRKPLTDDNIWDSKEIMAANGTHMQLPMSELIAVVRAVEAVHGIKE